jgi:hypothetical protein
MIAECKDCTRLSSEGVHPSIASSSAAVLTTNRPVSIALRASSVALWPAPARRVSPSRKRPKRCVPRRPPKDCPNKWENFFYLPGKRCRYREHMNKAETKTRDQGEEQR